MAMLYNCGVTCNNNKALNHSELVHLQILRVDVLDAVIPTAKRQKEIFLVPNAIDFAVLQILARIKYDGAKTDGEEAQNREEQDEPDVPVDGGGRGGGGGSGRRVRGSDVNEIGKGEIVK